MTRPPVRIIYEKSSPNREPIEHLRYSIEVFDYRDNSLELLGRLPPARHLLPP
jgi:hypothetical protein